MRVCEWMQSGNGGTISVRGNIWDTFNCAIAEVGEGNICNEGEVTPNWCSFIMRVCE